MNLPLTSANCHRIVKLMVLHQPGIQVEISVRLWQDLVSELVPIIGEGGFRSLYERSIHLAAASHPWMANGFPVKAAGLHFEALQTALQSQDADEAGNGSVALFTLFIGILSTLIGEHLTVNLLRAAWGDEAIDKAAKEQRQ